MNALFRVISLCFCVIQWPFYSNNSRSSFVRLFIMKNLFFALMLNGAFVFTSPALDKLSTFLPFLSSKARGRLGLLSSSVRRGQRSDPLDTWSANTSTFRTRFFCSVRAPAEGNVSRVGDTVDRCGVQSLKDIFYVVTGARTPRDTCVVHP